MAVGYSYKTTTYDEELLDVGPMSLPPASSRTSASWQRMCPFRFDCSRPRHDSSIPTHLPDSPLSPFPKVNPLTKKEIKFSKDYRKVPIVRMGGEILKDSPVIIDALLSRLREAGAMSDEEYAVFCSADAEKWATWADKQLAVLLFPNITRNFSESYQVEHVHMACLSVIFFS